LPRLEDLNGLDILFLAPAASTPFGQRKASRPFGAAEGRHALGPELARRVLGEVDHHAMAVEAAHAGALVRLTVLVDSLELDAHVAPLPGCANDPGDASLHARERAGWHVGAGKRTHVPTVMKQPPALIRAYCRNLTVSWSHWAGCGTCYSAPNICSSKPWWPCRVVNMSNGTSSALNSEQDLASIPMAGGGLSRLAIARLKSAGVEVAPLLRRAGLTPEVIANPEERLSVRSQVALLDEAAIALKDDCLGFTLARDFDPREIGLLYYVMASSQTLGDGLKRVARYSQITNEAVVVRYQEGNRLIISLSYSGVPRHSDRHQIEFCMFGVL